MTLTEQPAPAARQVMPAEERYAAELAFLAAQDTGPRPPGWALTPARSSPSSAAAKATDWPCPSGVPGCRPSW